MLLATEIQSLAPSALLELYELDLRPAGGTSSLYFHAGTNGLSQPVVWQGATYQAWPIETEGFELSAKGVLPRPKVRVANVGGVMSAEVMLYDDLIGCRLIRRRVFASCLDAVNFTGGNPNADTTSHMPDELWFVERKTVETRFFVEWELSSAFDLQGVKLPYRQVIQNTCAFVYKGAECGYTGTLYFDRNDTACAAGQDDCAKRLNSCRIRHKTTVSTAQGTQTVDTSVLPFGGFPGATRHGQ
jgi:lambda family phage minor tail protein L